VKTEIARGFGPNDDECHKLVRVIALNNLVEGAASFFEAMKAEQDRYIAAFEIAYKQLIAKETVTCFATQAEFPALPAPKVVVIDFVLGQLAHVIHKHSGATALAFCSGMASFGYMAFAPVERGGRLDFKAKALEEAKKTERPLVEVADDLFHVYTDDVIEVPGLPKMYHYEYDPQDIVHMSKALSMGSIWLGFLEAYIACDGMIITSPEAYEPHAIAATKDWFAENSRSVWAVGPLVISASSQQAVLNEEAQSEKSADIKKFLDNALAERGKLTVLYISFGSVFWPREANQLEAFIDVVIEKEILFIFSYGSPMAQMSDAFKAKIEQSGLGLLSRWSPQQTILTHAALGWFVTHAGHNSTLEGVQAGVPMICWPFSADQPANAVNLAENHDVAYELIEVRTGNGLRPRYRTDKVPLGTVDAIRAETREVLDKAFGEDGARKRVNMKKLQKEVNSAWDKGGSAEVDMSRFLEIL